jgi:bifunctional non-homologous end joining protein LigD
MECLSVSKLPEDSQWLWEIKLDGYRAIAVKSGSDVKLFSRQKKSLNTQFPSIVEGLTNLPAETVVDGELVAIDDTGRPDFNLLQNFRSEASRIHYCVFDLLCCNSRDLTRLPLIERRRANLRGASAQRICPGLAAPSIREATTPCDQKMSVRESP